MKEAEFQNLIRDDSRLANDIAKLLEVVDTPLFLKEDEYINGMIADFTLISNNKIKSIIECKGGNINVTDYVRGIGQVLQYEYFCENKVFHKSYEYDDSFSTALIFPSEVLQRNNFNVGKFKYPKSTKIIEVNNVTKAVREIKKVELDKLQNLSKGNLTSISQYYVRDNRFFELYILLKYLTFLKMKGFETIKRSEIEDKFLKKIETINNGNWRNAFISLASLGFICNNNLPTSSGMRYAGMNYEDFLYDLYDGYLAPYLHEIFQAFNFFGKGKLDNGEVSYKEICNFIRKKHKNKDVLFLTESGTRYLSSWLNILRDDFGCLSFRPRSKKINIIYDPTSLNKEAFVKNILKNSIVSKKYIGKYHSLL